MFDEIHPKRCPAILRGLDIGSCLGKWTAEYLSQHVGNKPVKIHVSETERMNFLTQNFQYKTLPFDQIIKRSSVNEHLRVAFEGVQLWTHYDVMDNLLVQVTGKKRAVLYSPEDLPYLYLEGDKSRVIDIDSPDLELFPDFVHVTSHECIMEPGDILFIPALWFHNMTSLEFSVAVNVFWRNLNPEVYDKKDPYGNKDPLPASKVIQYQSFRDWVIFLSKHSNCRRWSWLNLL